MKFTCPQCETRYAIPDEKVPPGKSLRFSCKNCNNVIRLRRKDKDNADLDAETTLGLPPGVQLQNGALAHAPIEGAQPKAQSPFEASPQPESVEQWFVLTQGAQQGPMGRADVEQMLAAGNITPRTYVWREGMPDWVRLGELEGFVKPVATKTPRPPQLRTESAESASENVFTPAKSSPFDLLGEVAAAATPGEGEGPEPTPDFLQELRSPSTSLPEGSDYFEAPPGEATRVFMATAGIFKRRRRQRIAAVIASVVTLLFCGIISLDLLGYYTIPGMGLVYEVTGVADPNLQRATERTQAKLESAQTEEERQALRDKLLGLTQKASESAKTARPKSTATTAPAALPQEGVKEVKTLSDSQRALAADIFADSRKKETTLKAVDSKQIRTPNLPSGLTQEAIFNVISENSTSMRLCMAQSMKKGERVEGKMEIALTIEASGSVSDAEIETPKFRTTTIGTCTVKRVKTWRFPAFNGEPVTVVFPYVLSAGF